MIGFASKVITRAEARSRAAVAAQQAIEAEKTSRASLRREREAFAALLIPLVFVSCIVWIGLLAFGNVRERSAEIGILRAVGVRSKHILSIFLIKAAVSGFLGAFLGYCGGFLVGTSWGEIPVKTQSYTALLDPHLFVLVQLLAPVLSAIAALIPAFVAAQQDPAVTLQER